MATGTVKWFNNAKGYGFVLSEDKGEDLFIHYSSIEMDGYKSLKAGQEVEYDVQAGPKGMHAVNIRSAATTEGAEETQPDPAQAAVTADTAPAAQSAAPAASNSEPVEDDLHINPMHSVPPLAAPSSVVNGNSQSNTRANTAPRQVEVELE